MTKHIRKTPRVGLVCKCGCGQEVVQLPGSGRPRQWIEGHKPAMRRRAEPKPVRKCACGCGLDAIRLYSMGPPPRYFPGHSPSDKKEPWKAKRR